MTDSTVLVVFDTPSIKQFVFGTDPLREVRGASALLDELNRSDCKRELARALPTAATVEEVYANGGSAQYVVDGCEAAAVRNACCSVVQHFMRQTAGQVQPVFGIAALSRPEDYRMASAAAHFELRNCRELCGPRRVAQLFPLVAECASASNLPATGLYAIGGEQPRFMSDASRTKEKRGRLAKGHGVWAQWMRHQQQLGPWPDGDRWNRLRCDSIADIGNSSGLDGYVGLVYADGNAMGRVVQQLDSPATCRVFSRTVDGCIREACFQALDSSCTSEIGDVRQAMEAGGRLPILPVDILLLGGDDLLVALPADRAILFASEVSRRFQQLTAERLKAITDTAISEFFSQHVGDRGFTVSCGVAIARSSYPFYLLLELAEELLRNAKRRESGDAEASSPTAPASPTTHVDFHAVSGSASFQLDPLRQEEYFVETEAARTLRPLSLDQLAQLQDAVAELRSVAFPRSKLHALHEAALDPNPVRAERAIRDIFARCKFSGSKNERETLWQAIRSLTPPSYEFRFPWFQQRAQRVLAVADIVEALDLFEK